MASDDEKLRTLLKNTLEKMAKSSSGERRELLNKIKDTINQIDIDVLGLVLDNRVFKKAVNRKIFIQLVQALEYLDPADVTPEEIESVLRDIDYQRVQQAFENKVKGDPLDALGDALKAFAGVVVEFTAPMALAALIALVSIGARYAGIGVIKVGEKIKEGAMNLMGKTSKFQVGGSNFDKLNQSLETIFRIGGSSSIEAKTFERLESTQEIIKMLQNEEKQSAIKELIKGGTIKDFSEDDMKRLMKKGNSTNPGDEKAFHDLMDEFKTAIMALGNNRIYNVKKKVDEKVNEMKPQTKTNAPGVEQIASTGKEGPGGGNS